MSFLANPNLPEYPVRLAAVGGNIGAEAEIELKKMGIDILRIPRHNFLHEAVSSHPDMLLFHAGEDLIIHAPGVDKRILDILASYGFRLLEGCSALSRAYPADIAYNVARVGKWYFHNLKYTDRVIREQMDRLGIEAVHVSQGYSKCSVLPVDSNSLITTDVGIARAAEKKGLDVLLLKNEKSIRLPGLDHGFIGGACGMVSKSVCAINGSLEKLSSKYEFASFLSEKNILIKELSSDYVTDIGSILPLAVSECSN